MDNLRLFGYWLITTLILIFPVGIVKKTPIFAAVDSINVEILEFLLESGADLHVTREGLTPLKQAVANEDVDMVQAFVNHPGVEVEEALELAYDTMTRVPITDPIRKATLAAIVEALSPSGPVLK